MIGRILKVIATLFICYLIGLTFGAIFGIFLGGIPALFFREIVKSNQSVLISIIMSLILGGLIGLLAILLANKVFITSDKLLFGVLLGIASCFFVVFFIEGVIYVSDTEMFTKPMSFYPLIFSGRVGSYIGSIVFLIIGSSKVIRDVLAPNTLGASKL